MCLECIISILTLCTLTHTALANEATKYEKEIIQDHQRFYSEQVKPVAVRQHPIPEIPQDWRYEKSKYALLNEKESQDPFKSSKTFEKAISVEVVPQQTAAMPFDHMPVMLDNLEAELKPIQESSSVQESSPVTNENTELPLNNSPDTIEQATESVITTAEAVKQSDLLVTADADPIINDNVIASLKVEERSEQPMKLDQLDVIENNEELQKYLEIVKRNRVPSQQSSDGELSAAEGSARQSASDVDLYERNTDNGSDEMR